MLLDGVYTFTFTGVTAGTAGKFAVSIDGVLMDEQKAIKVVAPPK